LFRIAEDFVALIRLAYFDARDLGLIVLKPLYSKDAVLSKLTGRVANELATFCFLPEECIVDSFLFIARKLYD
jgi:hypothetical protein